MKTRPWLSALVLSFLAAGACTPASIPSNAPADTPAVATSAITPTEILWFPPTETQPATVATTPAPTPERKPGVGALITADDMTTATHWNATTASGAAVSVSSTGLTISAEPGQPAVVSLHRSAIVDNAYMEVTARPSLCRDRDAYGLVFRAPNQSAYYRFLSICNGMAAAERFSRGSARVLQPPTASADAPPGAPGEVRLGIWAFGSEFRFFLNGHYQFTVEDRSYFAGGIGVFAEAAGDTPVAVTFSDLAVYRLIPAAVMGTATP